MSHGNGILGILHAPGTCRRPCCAVPGLVRNTYFVEAFMSCLPL